MGVRIWDDNFVDASTVTASYQSSEQSAFPATNVLNFARRSKSWRSNGYWDITSSNNGIVFRESVGVDLTASIAVAEYTDTSTFLAAIKTALDAAGASTYTVTTDSSTFKIIITSNGAGGGGVFQLMWTDANSTSYDVLGYDNGADDTGALTYTADNLRIHTSEWLTYDFGLPSNPKAFALIGERNSAIKISSGATINIQGNATNSWASPTDDVSITYYDDVMFSYSATGLWSTQHRFARIKIVDTSNPTGYVEVGAVYFGDVFDPTRGRAQYPFNGTYVDRSLTSFSEGGQTFTDIRPKAEIFTVRWLGLTIAEKESIDTLWDSVGIGKPFFVQFDPDAAFSSAGNKMLRYVKFETAPSYELVSPANFSCRMVFREEL